MKEQINAVISAIELVAKMHDEEAQHMNRLGDPGMANHHRAWAAKIRRAAAPIAWIVCR